VRSLFSFRSLLYLLYALVLTAILLYVRFPTEKFKTFCERRLEQAMGKRRCTIGEIVYHFPAAIEFRKVKISASSEEKNSGFLVDRLMLSPSSEGIFTSWQLNGELYEGLIKAVLVLQIKEKVFQLRDVRIKGVNVAAIIKSVPSLKREITGELTASGEYKAEFEQPMDGLGHGKLGLSGGNVQLVQQILTLNSIGYKEVNVLWKYGKSILHLTGGKMAGLQLDADFAGTVQAPFLSSKSSLNISGFFVPKEQFFKDKPQVEKLVQRLMQRYKKSAVPFRVGGTMKKPTFRLSM